jgi:GT2 family glycosyltransferase
MSQHSATENNNAGSVAIILVNWNSFDVTNDCIHSLKELQYLNFAIIVVDNGSADGSGQKLQQAHEGITVLYADKNLGFTGGNNMGLRYALANNFEYAMMLNNDTFVEPDFLTHLINYISTHPETGAIQPRIHFNHDRTLLWNGGSYFNRWVGFTYTSGENRVPAQSHMTIKPVDWVTGCAFLVRSSVLRKTGLLAENMFIYSEDADLSFRIKELGYDLMYIPDSVIYHIAGVSNKSKVMGKEGFVNPIVHYLNQRNRLWVLKRYTKWYHTPTVVVANFFYILMVMCYFATRRRFGKLKAMKDAVKDGLRGSVKYD